LKEYSVKRVEREKLFSLVVAGHHKLIALRTDIPVQPTGEFKRLDVMLFSIRVGANPYPFIRSRGEIFIASFLFIFDLNDVADGRAGRTCGISVSDGLLM